MIDLKDLSIGTVIRLSCKVINQGTNICEVLSSLFKGAKRLFVVTHAIAGNVANNEAGIKDNKEYFLPRSEGEILKIITY